MMSVGDLAWAWALDIGNPHAKLLLIALANDYGTDEYQTLDREKLQAWAGLANDQFREALLRLQQIGVEFRLGPMSEDPADSMRRIRYRLPCRLGSDRAPCQRPPRKPDDRQGWLYVIAGGGKTKIGISRSLYERLSWLQSGNPERLTLCMHFCGPFEEIRLLERHMHKLFKHSRVAGEWFDCSPAEVVCVINEEIDRLGLTIKKDTR